MYSIFMYKQKKTQIEEIGGQVSDTGDVYFVPAFSGLFAPHWRTDARGLIIGITQYTTKAHIVRATLEAIAFQNMEIVESMNKDSGIKLKELQVSGGMSNNKLLLQMQADLLGIPVGNSNNLFEKMTSLKKAESESYDI